MCIPFGETFSFLPRSKSSVKVKVKYQGHFFQEMAVTGRGSVVKCLTCNPGVLGLSCTRFSGFFRGSVLGQDTSEPSLVLVKTRKDMNNVGCCRDWTEIPLKAA